MIILILILFSGLDTSNGNETTSIDLFVKLKSKNISCDLHDFVKSTDNSDDEYKLLIQDLTKYCLNSSSYQLLCHMIYLELELACLLPNNIRPSPTKYTFDYRSKQICSINKIALTNEWIWGKLSSNEKKQIGSTSVNLCSKITSTNETLRLVKFFYKIAPRIRRFDTMNRTSHSVIINPIDETSAEKINLENKKLPEVLNQTLEDRNKTIVVNRTSNQSKTIEFIAEKKIENETKKSEEGSPFGRAGNNQERQQINERPKPKVLDVESVFKVNNDEERNWVEGKNLGKQGNILPPIKLDENPLFKSQFIRKRSPFKIKLNRHLDDDDAKHDKSELSNSFITTILVFILCIVVVYLILHNKNKILGLIIEGCKRRRALNNRRTHVTTHRTRLSQSTIQ